MHVNQVKLLIAQASETLRSNETYLSSLDAETGDGDHGVTIAKIALSIADACTDTEDSADLCELFDNIYSSVMDVDGGSAGPLWAQMFCGISEALEGVGSNLSSDLLRQVYQFALDGLNEISNAKPGDKTMKDSLIPAAQAASSCPSDAPADILAAAAEAAEAGAEATREMIAKYGRAKNLKDASIGHLDPGAVSVAVMVRALSDQYRTIQ